MTTPASAATYGTAGYQPRILIVDDEPFNRDLMELMLAPHGYLLESAASGEAALARVAQQPPDLILLDVMMPEMDGYEVASRIKNASATRHIPIVMVTALNDRASIIRGLDTGAEEFLTKPIDNIELLARVKNLLRLKAYGDFHNTTSRTLEGEVELRTTELVERTKTLEHQAAVLGEQAALLDLVPSAIVVGDLQSRISFWSRGAEAMYGWTQDEAMGKVVFEFLHTEFPEPLGHIYETLLRDGQWAGEVIQYGRHGNRLINSSQWALQRHADGSPARILTINNDVTEQRHADAEYRLLSERLSLATAVAQVGVWEWDLATNALTWDATMFEIYGLPPIVPMAYQRWAVMVYPDDLPLVEATYQNAIAQKGQGDHEFRIVTTGGAVRYITSAARVVLDDRGAVVRLIGVNRDVTENKQADDLAAMSQRDQLRFKDEFLSHVSHELRSPLTAIKQFTSILLTGLAGELNPEQREYQEIVLKNIHQLQSMIDDLLEVTRLEAGKLTVELERVTVLAAVTDTMNTLQGNARAKGVTLSWDIPADLPDAFADQTRLRQILIILVDNAIKFSHAGASARIRVRVSTADPDSLQFDVVDDGCGISPEVAEKIFDRLYRVSEIQTSRKGLGLGLFICKELVTRHGGRIWVESQPQEGSTFSFTLPVFSLASVIAPLLKSDRWPAESVALVTVELGLSCGATSGGARDELCNEARSVVGRCLLPDLDVLLPKMAVGAKEERFFIAAFTGENGASVLANRISTQFAGVPIFKERGVTPAVSVRMLPQFPSAEGRTREHIVMGMAAALEQLVRHQIGEPVNHG